MAYSLSQTADLNCPKCDHPFPAAIWLIVDIVERRDLLERIRAGTLHDLPCPHCGHVGQVDVPLLLYLPGEEPPFLFSSAQQTSKEEDQEQAAGLLSLLHDALGGAWQDTWLEEMPVVARHLLPAIFSDDPESVLRELQQAVVRVAEEDPEVMNQLAEMAQQTIGDDMPLLMTLQQFISADTWIASYHFIQTHPELLNEEVGDLLARLAQAAQLTGDENAGHIFEEHLALLRRCRETNLTTAFAEKMGVPPEALAAQSELEKLPPAMREVLAELAQSGADISSPEDLERFLAAQPDLRAKMRDAIASQAAQELAEEDADPTQALADSLIAWIQTPNWDQSEAYLREYEAELLADEAERVLILLQSSNPQNTAIPEHLHLLKQCRQAGITRAYQQFHYSRFLAHLPQQGPIGWAVVQFIQVEDDNTAVSLLQTQSDLLLTLDAGRLLEQLAQAVQELGDKNLTAHWMERRQMWQAAYQARVGRPLRVVPGGTEPQAAQPESWTERVEQQAVQAERGNKYTVVSAHNSAIGDNALVINNVGQLPLRWRRPSEGDPVRARAAVGREAELAELHQRLLAGQSAALVSRGTSAALRGQPSIGKTTLAAMYADRFGNLYPGGVFWLTVGPYRRTADSVADILQRMATFAYDADPQANSLLENTMFASDIVRGLLNDHGALLVVIDDVWHPAALRELQAALPTDTFTLLTTRDYDVAYTLENSPTAIQQLDVLSATDARLLLQKGAPGLPGDLADRVAIGLGRHAHALSLAAGALHKRGMRRYEQTAAELLARVAAGQGFGDLPRMDQTERLTEVEIAFKYSYDYLAEGSEGADCQAWFRSLGVFAQEADFDTAATTAILATTSHGTEEFLLLLKGLGLLQEGENGRWQQHAILRAYALSLQTTEERILFPERHADYFINLTQVCHESKPRDYDRVEQEFAQIQHAFTWCEQQSPRRATRLTLLLNDFMRNRGRVTLLNQWLQTALQGAEIHGDRLGKANTLQSLGDLESRLGNIEAARGHYATAQQLFDLERDPMGRMNVWIGLARLEASEGNISQAQQLFEKVFALADELGFGRHPVTLDLRREYAQLGQSLTGAATHQETTTAQAASQDQITLALTTLLQVNSAEALQAALVQHPALRELPTLAQLAARAAGAQVAGHPEAARHLLARLLVLLEQYNIAHAEQIDAVEQGQFVGLLEALLSLAEESGEDLATSLRHLLGWALNTLGNYYATQPDHAAAVEHYTQAISHAPANAMLFRNRAGEHLEMGQLVLAAADIEQAALLEPEAPRLVELRQTLAQQSS